ncbi:MAG: hypothetical protein ABI658_26750 [Acidimicrobiales bacterium]
MDFQTIDLSSEPSLELNNLVKGGNAVELFAVAPPNDMYRNGGLVVGCRPETRRGS